MSVDSFRNIIVTIGEDNVTCNIPVPFLERVFKLFPKNRYGNYSEFEKTGKITSTDIKCLIFNQIITINIKNSEETSYHEIKFNFNGGNKDSTIVFKSPYTLSLMEFYNSSKMLDEFLTKLSVGEYNNKFPGIHLSNPVIETKKNANDPKISTTFSFTTSRGNNSVCCPKEEKSNVVEMKDKHKIQNCEQDEKCYGIKIHRDYIPKISQFLKRNPDTMLNSTLEIGICVLEDIGIENPILIHDVSTDQVKLVLTKGKDNFIDLSKNDTNPNYAVFNKYFIDASTLRQDLLDLCRKVNMFLQ